ncbi:MAG: sensor histidine kinase [Rudanella sp.]|nr:sensor histidine kinase [Rudanella sp.]
MKLSSLRPNRAVLRGLLYVSILVVPIVISTVNPETKGKPYTMFGITFNTVFLLAAWAEHALVLNRFLNRKQYLWAVLGSIGAGFVFIGARYLAEQQVTRLLFGAVNYYPEDLTLGYYIIDNQYFAIKAVALGALFKLLEDWFRHQQERKELVGEKTTAELAFLKSQINPHFLFNTLNNIYALAYAKSDAAPGAILKLSELMRYMLYESTGNPQTSAAGLSHKVSLTKEIQYLQNLVDLEKLRVPNAQVQFEVKGNPDLYRVEPMLLISFVENAFKHGDLTDPNHPLVIHLSVRQGKLVADVLNKKSRHQKDTTGGIGLPNVRRRLDLLYPNQYSLKVDEDDQTYSCRLELTL